MRLFNQTKNALSWAMGGEKFACEPWGPVDIPDEMVDPAKRRGLPLGEAPIAPELRAQQRIADEADASKLDALRSLKAQVELAVAGEKSAKDELGRVHTELSSARDALRQERAKTEKLGQEVARLKADKEAAEQLLAQESARAVDAETRAIKAEALLQEASKPVAKQAKAARAD